MGKWVIAMVGLVALMGILVWQLQSGGPTKIVIELSDAGPIVALAASDARPTQVQVVRRDAKPVDDAAVAQYDPQSEEFSHEVDVTIPNTFKARLARCNRKGIDPDAQITLNYRLHIEGGVVRASNVKIAKSNLGDAALEQCMVSAVDQARWEATDMPDFMEDQDIIIRIRSLNKYLSEEEQAAAKEADRAENGF